MGRAELDTLGDLAEEVEALGILARIDRLDRNTLGRLPDMNLGQRWRPAR